MTCTIEVDSLLVRRSIVERSPYNTLHVDIVHEFEVDFLVLAELLAHLGQVFCG